MALKLRQSSASRVKLLSTFIAVFALLAQPMYGFVASQVANATDSHSVDVRTEAELLSAAADKGVTVIHVRADIDLDQKIVLSGRNVNVKGHGNKLKFNGVDGWNSEYVIQAYKNYISVGSLSISGGDAAIYANGATVRILGTVDVSNNEFGGIELSRGSGVTGTPVLNLSEAGANLVNSTEETTKPTVWVDKVSNPSKGAVSVVNGGSFTKTTHIGVDQHQYYLRAANANILAVNTTDSTTYDNVQSAVDAAAPEDTIKLLKDVSVSRSILITKPLTFDGNGLTVMSAFGAGATSAYSGVIEVQGVTDGKVRFVANNNKAFRVAGEGNKAIDGPGPHNGLHGINVYNSNVELNNVILNNNGKSGLNVGRNSVAVVNNISTSNNGWYGINVDKTTSGAYSTLTVNGVSKHIEGSKPHIFSDSRDNVILGTVKVNDTNRQYVRNWNGAGYEWLLDLKKPEISLSVDAYNPTTFGVVSSDDQGVATIEYTIWKDNVKIGTWGQGVIPWNDRQNFSVTNSTYKSSAANAHLPLTGLEDGKYVIHATATDAMGKSTNADGVAFTVDHTQPVLKAHLSDSMINKTDGNPALNIDEVSDLLSTIDHTAYRIKDANAKNITGYNWVTFVSGDSVDVSSLPDGSYVLRVRAFDSAGNTKGISVPFIVKKTAPIVSFDGYIGTSTTPTLTGKSDAGEVEIVINDRTAVRVPVVNGLWSYAVTVPLIRDVPNLITVTSTDEAGNVGTTDTFDEFGSPVRKVFVINTPYVQAPGDMIDPAPELNPSRSLAALFSTPSVTPATADVSGTQDEDILGARDTKTASPEKTVAVIEPSTQGWKLFGLAWFWWVLMGALIAMIWWWIAAARRRSQEA